MPEIDLYKREVSQFGMPVALDGGDAGKLLEKDNNKIVSVALLRSGLAMRMFAFNHKFKWAERFVELVEQGQMAVDGRSRTEFIKGLKAQYQGIDDEKKGLLGISLKGDD